MIRSRRMARRGLLAALLTLSLGTLAGCGEPVMGGSGRIVAGGPAGPLHVVVEGAPYEMGFWQGRLLAEQIHRLHPRWQAAALGEGEAGRALDSACRLYADQTLRLLPEALRQELEGLSDGSGVPVADLLLTEVLWDGLRFHGQQRRWFGDLSHHRDDSGVIVSIHATSEDAPLIAEEGILLERRPVYGTPTLLVTWPGSLGGVAGITSGGRAVVSSMVALSLEQQSLRGLPFTWLVRGALETGGSTGDLLRRLAGGTAHRVLVVAGISDVQLGLAAQAVTPVADLSGVASLHVPAATPVGEVEIPGPSTPAPSTPGDGEGTRLTVRVAASGAGRVTLRGPAGELEAVLPAPPPAGGD